MKRGRADSPIDLDELIKGCNSLYESDFNNFT